MSVALMIFAMNIIVAVVINTIYTITVIIVSKGTDENKFQGRYSLVWGRISLMQHNTEEDL